jgi:hypothetical protein
MQSRPWMELAARINGPLVQVRPDNGWRERTLAVLRSSRITTALLLLLHP